MEWYEAEVAELERRLTGVGTPPEPVVFYGSSSIRLWERLALDLDEPRALNLGFGGSTLEACALYFERLILRAAPTAVVLYAGDNDLGDGQPVHRVILFLRAFLQQLRQAFPGIPLAFISIKPSPARWSIDGRIREANARAAEVLARDPRARFLDVYHPMLGDDGRPRRELYEEDGLHLTRAGYAVWTEVVGEARHFLFNGS